MNLLLTGHLHAGRHACLAFDHAKALGFGFYATEEHVSGDVQPAVSTESAVGGGFPRQDLSQQLALWRKDKDSTRAGRPNVAFLIDSHPVRQSGKLADIGG